VALLLLAALGIRVAYIDAEPYHAINDAGTYNRMASMIATWGDYHTGDAPRSGAGGSRGPTAYFPPAFPYYLAVADLVDGHEAGGRTAVPPERIEMAVTGTITVALIGLVALEAFGEGAAWAAMVLTALYPAFIELSGILVAENLLVPLELAAVWSLLRARRSPHPYPWIAGAGVLAGLGALTHENALLFVIPFAIGAWLAVRSPAVRATPPAPADDTASAATATRGQSRRRPGLRALAAPLLLIVLVCATIAPWTIRNAVELHSFVPIADETGITLAGTYNRTSAGDKQVPYKWHLFSHVPSLRHFARHSASETEVQLSDKLQQAAINYIKAHPTAPLQAAGDNTLRMLELEGTFAWRASTSALNIHEPWAGIGVSGFYVLGLLAIAGLFTRRARRAPAWLWLMPILYWLSIVVVNVETPRFREPIDPFFLLLAACAVSAAAEGLAARLGLRGTPVRSGGRSPQLTRDEPELVQMVKRLA